MPSDGKSPDLFQGRGDVQDATPGHLHQVGPLLLGFRARLSGQALGRIPPRAQWPLHQLDASASQRTAQMVQGP